jgi:hypothetical protein
MGRLDKPGDDGRMIVAGLGDARWTAILFLARLATLAVVLVLASFRRMVMLGKDIRGSQK